MAHNLSWLQACKSSQLKAIAIAIGINSSGAKPVLTSQLLQHLPIGYFNHDAAKLHRNQYDIISLDMGIRNLAYCRLRSPNPLSPGQPNLPSWDGLPVITQWTRVAISKSQTPSEPATKEPFDPSTYSAHAYTLISTLLRSSPHPTQILIERQRFRSMGASAVQEWTLRVNMFEAMLYAVLKTMSEKGMWNGKVYPVAPGKVAKFWLGEKEGSDEEGVGRGSKSARTKGAKVGLVAEWLERWREGDGRFRLEGEAEVSGMAYLRKRDGRKVGLKGAKNDGVGERGPGPAEMGKLDDLADCLLQAMAWIKWEQNRRSIMAKGIEALDNMS